MLLRSICYSGLAVFILLCRASAFTPSEPGLYAVFNTTLGEFTAKLEFEKVPLTVASFVGLAEGTTASFDLDSGEPKLSNYFNGIIFHRVVAGFVIQGGDPLGLGTGGPGYNFPDEMDSTLSHSSAGILSMANSGINTNGSQFFITLAATTFLDGRHAVFGRIVDGLSVVQAIGAVPTDGNPPAGNNRPLTNVVINSVTIVREGAAAEGFDPSRWQVPTLKATPVDFDFTNASRRILFDRESDTEYFVYDSNELSNWNKVAEYPAESTTPTQVALDITNSLDDVGQRFFQVTRKADPQRIDKNGTRIIVTLEGNPAIDITMGQNFQGTYVFDGANGAVLLYEWFEVGKLIQLKVDYSGLRTMQFYFDPGSQSGPVFTRVRESAPGENDGFKISGTFQIQ